MNTDDRFFIIADNFKQQINAHDLVVCELILDLWGSGNFDNILKTLGLKNNVFGVIEEC